MDVDEDWVQGIRPGDGKNVFSGVASLGSILL